METEVIPGRHYRHYKGDEYELVGVAHHSETLEEMIVYRGFYDSPEFGPNPIWARPRAIFVDSVELEGKRVPRFQLLDEE